MTGAPKLSQQEQQFVDYARRLSKHRDGRVAMLAQLSHLTPSNRQSQHIVVAQNCFNTLVSRYEGQLFRLSNADLVFIGRGVSRKDLREVENKLHFMFRDDPFIEQEALGTADPGLCVVYDIEKDYAAFMSLAQDVMTNAQRSVGQTRITPTIEADPETRSDAAPMRPRDLDRVESAIETLDVSRFMRRHFIYAVLSDAPPQPIFAERSVSIAALQNAVMPKCNLKSNRWLYRYLTTQLEPRMLQALASFDPDPTLPDSINFSVASALSREFLNFETKYAVRSKNPLIVEFHVSDIFSDVTQYEFASNFLHSRNCRVCVDELDPAAFIAVDHAELAADFTKVIWSADWAGKLDVETRRSFESALEKAGPTRVILMHCDDAKALEFGRKMGIKLYQGQYLDQIASQQPHMAVTA